MLDVTVTTELHEERFGQRPRVFAAPGRVNLIGEHTDYADGFVMPAAIDFATFAAISPREDGAVVLRSENFREQLKYAANDLPQQAKGTGVTIRWACFRFCAKRAWRFRLSA